MATQVDATQVKSNPSDYEVREYLKVYIPPSPVFIIK